MVDARSAALRLCLGLLIALPAPAGAQTAPSPGATADSAELPKVIAQLNTAAGKFTSAQADFTWDQYTAVVQQSEIQQGKIYFERKKGLTRMAAYLSQQNGQAAPKTILYDGGEVDYYEPTIKQLRVLKAGANRGQWESFLTLGFGGSGTDLEANWTVSVLGRETMNSVPVVKLDLVPIDPKVLQMFTHVTIWVDPTKGISQKQVFYEPGGDMRTATYKNILYNQPIPADIFKLQTAPGTTRVGE